MNTSFRYFLLVSAAILAVASNRAGIAGENDPVTVMNPAVANRLVERLPLSARLENLEGKTIYLVDINWGGTEAASNVFRHMSSWLQENIPAVKTVIRNKRGPYMSDDPELWEEIAAEGDAAIVGISG